MPHLLKSFLPDNPKFFFIPFWFIVGLILSTIPLIRGSNANLIYLGPALLWALAFLISGGILGFLFGIPTIISSNPNPPTAQNPISSHTSPAAQRQIVMANTNLTQVSDWVTKIIIGAGLVELGELPGFVKKVALNIGAGLEKKPDTLDYATAVSAGIFIFYLCYGFVFGYLIMRVILTELFLDDYMPPQPPGGIVPPGGQPVQAAVPPPGAAPIGQNDHPIDGGKPLE